MSAKVVGLGPSGSVFLLRRRGFGVDFSKRYVKACGESVPVETPMVEGRYVVDKVRIFRFFLWDREVGEVSYSKPRWYIIDKGRWVESMRARAPTGGDTYDVLVKAGGPYQSLGGKITVVRFYVEGARRPLDETADFIFSRDAVGFYWVFPHGGVLNVGGGFLGVDNPVPHVKKFVEKRLGGGRVVDVRGAPLTVKPRVVLHDGEGFRIGEAAGLVYPLTGEGIRPGVLSAIALAEALSTKKPLEEYRRKVAPIVKQVEFQKKLLAFATKAARRGTALLELADDGVLKDYVEENLSAKTLFTLLAKRPVAATKLVAALLR
ncbi:MAG: NAD(P)/FAD-dependent oxidoreductase [Pyrobaculum sp.]